MIATVVVSSCIVAALVAAITGEHWLALPAGVPVAAGLFVRAAGVSIDVPSHGWIVALSVAVVVLAVVAGGPLATWVLNLTDRSTTTDNGQPEVLRGGATIGYLERIAVVAAIALPQPGIIAAVIAIKG